ncbi:MAG: type II CAAX endopeptidase family protein [Eubacteriales bacterium]|nr:type II CAAX endopeptidase family protein [Eubacteriales bacterium]
MTSTADIAVKRTARVFLITVLLVLLSSILQATLPAYMGLSPLNEGVLTAGLILTPWILVLPTLVFVAKNRVDTRGILGLNRFKVSSLFISLVALIMFGRIISLVNLISMKLGAFNYVESSMTMLGKLPLSLLLIAIAVLPGIFEELQFRGLYYGTFRRMGYFRGAVLSALIFGLVHMNFNQFAYAFLMGIILAFIAEANSSTIVPMILHFVFNAMNVAALLLPSYYRQMAEKSGDPTYAETYNELKTLLSGSTGMPSWAEIARMLPLALFTAILGILLLRFTAKMNGREDLLRNYFKRGDVPMRRFFTPSGVIACVLLIGMMVSLAVLS